MHRSYARFYAAWSLAAVVLETVGVTRPLRWAQVGTLVAVEVVGVWFRGSKKGDTYSEFLRALTHDRGGSPLPARLAGVAMLAQYVTFCWWDLTPGGTGATLLALTFDAWLTFHWLTGGRGG